MYLKLSIFDTRNVLERGHTMITVVHIQQLMIAKSLRANNYCLLKMPVNNTLFFMDDSSNANSL